MSTLSETTIEEIATVLAQIIEGPTERTSLMYALRELFCPHCGRDHPERGYCQCNNDE